jgi:hypothetical protein
MMPKADDDTTLPQLNLSAGVGENPAARKMNLERFPGKRQNKMRAV